MKTRLSVLSRKGWMLGLVLAVAGVAVSANDELPRNRVSFSVSAQTEVANDTLVASLFHEASGKDIAALSGEVNQRIQWALAEAKKVPEVKAVTRDYTTQPVYHKDGHVDGWRVRQTIQLTSTDAGKLAALLGTLQKQLAMDSMGYTVSDATREQARTRLVGEAVKKFRARAQLIADAMQRPGWSVVKMDFDEPGRPMVRRFQSAEMVMMKASAAPPAIEAGEQTVSVNLRTEIELDPAH